MNADGFSDLVVSTYDGVVLVGPGSPDGFEKAERVLDCEGKPVALSKYYNWDKTEGKSSGWKYLMKGSKAHGTSVCPVDWDADGDFDLLIGDSGQGGLYVRMNEGTAQAPKFASENVPVVAGDRPAHIRSLVSDSQVVDWNEDGLFDIVLGGLGGGIYLLENSGTVATRDNQPAEPGTSIHLAVVDYDQDGKLDLLAGGRSMWIMDTIEGMTDADKQAVVKMESQLKAMNADIDAIYTKIETAEKDDRAKLTLQVKSVVDNQRKIDETIWKLKQKDEPNRRGNLVWLFKGK